MSHEVVQVPVDVEMDALFGRYVAAQLAPGLAYGLVGPEGLVHSAGFGVANDEGHAPDLDTVFPIASMTKSFVACAALVARDRGLIDLEAPISDYVTEFRASLVDGSLCRAPSVRMLLSMGGGLTEDNSWVDPFIGRPTSELMEAVARGITLSRPPGVAFEYSNVGFTLAGLAVGKAVGMSIEQWVRASLLEPLLLNATRFDNDTIPTDGALVRATGYHLDTTGAWVGYPPATSDAFAAAGGIQSTVRDLARWIAYLASAFHPERDDGGPASSTVRREMQRLHQIDLPSLAMRADGAMHIRVAGYGLGLVVTEDLHRGTIVMHSGGLPGFTLNMTWHPDSGHGIVVATNSHRGNVVELSEEALQRVLSRHRTPAARIRLRPATCMLQGEADQLVHAWDDELAQRVFAPNIAFDRPLVERCASIVSAIEQVGPLRRPVTLGSLVPDIVSASSPAELTWAIPAERGELICMIHITSTSPAQIQEFEVQAAAYDTPRSTRPTIISPRRARLGEVSLSALPNTAVEWPES